MHALVFWLSQYWGTDVYDCFWCDKKRSCIVHWRVPRNSNIAPFERLWIIGQPWNIILRNTRATIILGGSQFTGCIPLSKICGQKMSKGFLNLILLYARSLLVYKLKPHKPYARLQEIEKKNTSKRSANVIYVPYSRRYSSFHPCCPGVNRGASKFDCDVGMIVG